MAVKLTDFWDIVPSSLVKVGRRFRGARYLFVTLMMEAVSTCETSIYFKKTTRRYILEGCYLHTYTVRT
jgi:hypothetical protein